jgi:transcription elongation factor
MGGIITHIYRNHAFVQCKSLFENGGLVAYRVRNLVLAGESQVMSSISVNARSAGPYMSPTHSKEKKRTSFSHHQVVRDRTIIGKTVKITAGNYKGKKIYLYSL